MSTKSRSKDFSVSLFQLGESLATLAAWAWETQSVNQVHVTMPFWKDLFEIVWQMFQKYSPWHDAIINLAGLRSKMTIPACWRCLSVVNGSVRCCHNFGDAHVVW